MLIDNFFTAHQLIAYTITYCKVQGNWRIARKGYVMRNRLEVVRNEVDRLIFERQPYSSRYFISHLYGVSRFCVLIALKRGLDAELAAVCGMLHDIYQVTEGVIKGHAINGAIVAGEILKATGLYSEDEIGLITSAISVHNKKRKIHEPYAEMLKDADVMDHSFCNLDYPVLEKEQTRYNNLLAEFGIGIYRDNRT